MAEYKGRFVHIERGRPWLMTDTRSVFQCGICGRFGDALRTPCGSCKGILCSGCGRTSWMVHTVEREGLTFCKVCETYRLQTEPNVPNLCDICDVHISKERLVPYLVLGDETSVSLAVCPGCLSWLRREPVAIHVPFKARIKVWHLLLGIPVVGGSACMWFGLW